MYNNVNSNNRGDSDDDNSYLLLKGHFLISLALCYECVSSFRTSALLRRYYNSYFVNEEIEAKELIYTAQGHTDNERGKIKTQFTTFRAQ